jgi:putative aldouronate transport system permease protein
MHYREHWSRHLFVAATYVTLIALALLCLFPLIHVLAISFSSANAAAAGEVVLWPVGFTTKAYEFALDRPEFGRAFLVSLQRVVLGTAVNMVLTVLVAYPLSKENTEFPMRTVYVWIFVLTMLFSGGLIPLYMVVRETHLLNSIWALILPNAVPVFNVVLLLNFFRAAERHHDRNEHAQQAGMLFDCLEIAVTVRHDSLNPVPAAAPVPAAVRVRGSGRRSA